MAKVFLGEKEVERLGETQLVVSRLSMEGTHYNGTYKVIVTKEDIQDGFIMSMPFARGNFNIRLADGRKSQKKLDKLNNYLEANKESLVSLWKEEQYQDMVNKVCSDVREQKII